MKTNQKGFGILEILISVVFIGLIGFVGWKIYQNSREESSDATTQTSVSENTNKTTDKKCPIPTNLKEPLKFECNGNDWDVNSKYKPTTDEFYIISSIDNKVKLDYSAYPSENQYASNPTTCILYGTKELDVKNYGKLYLVQLFFKTGESTWRFQQGLSGSSPRVQVGTVDNDCVPPPNYFKGKTKDDYGETVYVKTNAYIDRNDQNANAAYKSKAMKEAAAVLSSIEYK